MDCKKRAVERLKLNFERQLDKYGMELSVREYSYTINAYGTRQLGAFTDTAIKGIKVDAVDFENKPISEVNAKQGEKEFIISSEISVEDTDTNHYEFTYKGKVYLLVFYTDIGELSNASYPVARRIILKPKF